MTESRTWGLSRPALLVVVAAIAHVLIAWMMRTPGLGWGEDDAAYLLLGQDLRTLHYREIQDVLMPVHARFPPVFPGMLAVVGALVNDRLDALLAFVGLCSAVSVLLLFDGARRVIGAELAALGAVLYAFNPGALTDAGNLMSEAPFKLFLIAALWGLAREKEGARFAVIAGGATILAALTRSAGVVFIPTLALYWLLKRRYKWTLGLAWGAIPVAAWLAFTFAAPEAMDRRLYVADLMSGADTYAEVVGARFSGLFRRSSRYLSIYLPTAIAVPTVRGTLLDNFFWLGCLIVFGISGFITLLRRWTPAAMFLVAYASLLLVWRYAFARLARPITPLLILVLLVGASMIAGKVSPRNRRWMVYGLAGLLMLGAVRTDMPMVARARSCDRSAPVDSNECWPVPVHNYLRLAQWVRDSTPENAIFFVSKERAFYFHSGRKSINQDRALREDSASLGDYLRSRGVGFTAVTPVGVRAVRHNLLVMRACREFELVREFTDRTLLLRLRPAGPVGDAPDACAAMSAFRVSGERTQ